MLKKFCRTSSPFLLVYLHNVSYPCKQNLFFEPMLNSLYSCVCNFETSILSIFVQITVVDILDVFVTVVGNDYSYHT